MKPPRMKSACWSCACWSKASSQSIRPTVCCRRWRSRHGGRCPVGVTRALLPLADLLELVFGPDLDSAGRQLVRDMRALGRFGWLGGVLSRLILPPAAAPRGYVWEEAGRIVGNASLLPVAGHAERCGRGLRV